MGAAVIVNMGYSDVAVGRDFQPQLVKELANTVGTSPLSCDQEYIRFINRHFRAFTELLLGHLQNKPEMYLNQVELPLLAPVLEYVAGKWSQIDDLILIATDQDDAKYRSTDTIGAAQVIEKLHLLRYGTLSKVNRITTCTLAVNPADYDTMLQELPHKLRETIASLGWTQSGSPEPVYIFMASGTPAGTFALFHGAPGQIPELQARRRRYLYLPRGKRQVIELQVGWTVQRDQLRDLAHQMMQQFRYGTLAEVMEKVGVPPEVPTLLRVMEDRMAFRFAEASQRLQENPKAAELLPGLAETLTAAHRGVMASKGQDLAVLDAPDSKVTLGEWSRGLIARWQMNDVTGYLAILVGLVEQLLRLQVRTLLVSWPGSEPKSKEILKALPIHIKEAYDQLLQERQEKEEQEDIGDREDREERKKRKPKPPRFPNQPFYCDILVAASRVLERDRGADLIRLVEWREGLKPVIDLRNEAVHELRGLERDDLTARFQSNQPSPSLNHYVLDYLQHHQVHIPSPDVHPYAEVNQVVMGIIESLNQPPT